MLEQISNGFTEPAECQQKRIHVLKFCQIKCKPGYQLVGEPITQCLQIQKWSTKLPKCEPSKFQGTFFQNSCFDMEIRNLLLLTLES